MDKYVAKSSVTRGKLFKKSKTARALSSGTCQARSPVRIFKNGNKQIKRIEGTSWKKI